MIFLPLLKFRRRDGSLEPMKRVAGTALEPCLTWNGVFDDKRLPLVVLADDFKLAFSNSAVFQTDLHWPQFLNLGRMHIRTDVVHIHQDKFCQRTMLVWKCSTKFLVPLATEQQQGQPAQTRQSQCGRFGYFGNNNLAIGRAVGTGDAGNLGDDCHCG